MTQNKFSYPANVPCKIGLRYYYMVKYKGSEYPVRMMDFQRYKGREIKEISCVVTEDKGRVLKITQDYALLIEQMYKIGEVYQFSIADKRQGYYTVTDPNDLIFHLVSYGDATLRIGQSIKAKVLEINKTRVNLELIEDHKVSEIVPYITLDTLAERIDVDPESVEGFETLFNTHQLFERAAKLYDDGDGMWFVEAIFALDELLLGTDGGEEASQQYVEVFRKMSLFVLEESGFLNKIPFEERRRIMSRISTVTQHAEDYREAYSIIGSGKSREYIQRQLQNLKESGNLYQPERKFRIIMCIFNLDDELMSEMMDKVFDIIISGDKENWKAEPFRTAFVEMLELFIMEYRDKAIRVSGSELIHKLIMAIAIQQLLVNEQDDVDTQLNRATFYRLLTYIERNSSQEMLDNAYYSLFSMTSVKQEDLEYGWEDLATLNGLFYTVVFRDSPVRRRIDQRRVFRGSEVEFVVSNDEIVFQSSGIKPNEVESAKLLDWHKIHLNTAVPVKRLKDTGSFRSVVNWWKTVNSNFSASSASRSRKIKMDPPKGVFLNVKVVGTNDRKNSFLCEIVDDNYKGKGWLPAAEIVKYNVRWEDVLPEFFQDDKGHQLLYDVKVISDPDSSGFCMFSLAVRVDEYAEYLAEDEENCITETSVLVKGEGDWQKYDGPHMIGISEHGLSVRLEYDEAETKPAIGSVVKASVSGINSRNQLKCRYIEPSETPFTVEDAFYRLVQDVAFDLDYDEPEPVAEEIMEESVVREVIALIDRQSIMTNDKIQSYGLINLCEQLAIMIRDTALAGYYASRKEITAAFYEYEQSGWLDAEKYAKLTDSISEEIRSNDYVVNESLTKFKILDSLRHRDNADTLYEIRKSSTNASIRNAADLGLAILLTRRFDMSNIERQLQDRINEELGVHVKQSNMKDYGIETQELEFKSSVIYPAGNHMQPSPRMQGAVIMQTICGFLNSDNGGKLYIGVNKNGAACGVEQDLKFLDTDKDGYSRYVRGMVYKELGAIANQCITVDWEEDMGYEVYVLNIAPSPDLVTFRGQYWTRQDTEKRPLKPEVVDRFSEMHVRAYSNYLKRNGFEPITLKDAEAPEEFVMEEPKEETSIEVKEELTIGTSRWRQNFVFDYEDGYGIDTVAYLHMKPQWKYTVSDSCDYSSTELSLAIHEDERDGYLAFAYKSGHVNLVPIQDILNKTIGKQNARHAGETPLFVSPMTSDSALLTVWRTRNGELSARLDDAEEFDQHHAVGSMTDTGIVFPTCRYNSLVAAEVVSAEMSQKFKKFKGQGGGLGQKLGLWDLKAFNEELKLDLTQL